MKPELNKIGSFTKYEVPEAEELTVEAVVKAMRMGGKFRAKMGLILGEFKALVAKESFDHTFSEAEQRRMLKLEKKAAKAHRRLIERVSFLPMAVRILVVKAYFDMDEVAKLGVVHDPVIMGFFVAAKNEMNKVNKIA